MQRETDPHRLSSWWPFPYPACPCSLWLWLCLGMPRTILWSAGFLVISGFLWIWISAKYSCFTRAPLPLPGQLLHPTDASQAKTACYFHGLCSKPGIPWLVMGGKLGGMKEMWEYVLPGQLVSGNMRRGKGKNDGLEQAASWVKFRLYLRGLNLEFESPLCSVPSILTILNFRHSCPPVQFCCSI